MDNITIQEILEAVDSGNIIPFFQPQVNSLTGHVISAEALARWIKPDGSIMAPGSFVPKLEESNSVTRLDWSIATQVCQFLQKAMQEAPSTHPYHYPIAVNFSRWHIQNRDFADQLSEIADRYQVPHNLLEVEITESAMAEEAESVRDWILEIRNAGFTVAVDDFGSGLSSFHFIKDVPFDVLKIDKSLLSDNCENEKERIVLESIFYFAQRLGLVTVAEGVETIQQLKFLQTMGCDKIQGFYFSRPLSGKDYLAFIAQSRKNKDTPDILSVHSSENAAQLLLQGIFRKYPLVIFINASRNSYYMMAYENFSRTTCPSTGEFDQLIQAGALSMAPEDQEIFRQTFCRQHLLQCQKEGQTMVELICRQKGDDGIYRKVKTTDIFVRDEKTEDILVISLNENVE